MTNEIKEAAEQYTTEREDFRQAREDFTACAAWRNEHPSRSEGLPSREMVERVVKTTHDLIFNPGVDFSREPFSQEIHEIVDEVMKELESRKA